MGCGFGAANRKKDKKSIVGRISKGDFVLRKTTPFTNEYALEECIGNGTFAEVWEARNKATQQLRAVKIIKKALMERHPRLKQYINTEIVTLAKVVFFLYRVLPRIAQML